MSSIRISPHFNTRRHSSLSFGSRQHNSPISLGSDPPSSPRCAGDLLGPCFNTGPINGLLPSYFLSFILSNSFHPSLAVLLRYRSLSLFSLRCPYHPFILHYQAILLVLLSTPVGSHHLWLPFPWDSPVLPQLLLPLELLLVRSPLLQKSTFVSSPVLTDMLKSRTYSCISASFQHHALLPDCRVLHVGHRPESLSIP